MLRFLVIPLGLFLTACATTGGSDVQPAPVIVADHPDARLAAALAAELEARAADPARVAPLRPEMDALAAALWGQPNRAEPVAEPETPEVIPPGQSLLYGVHIASYRTMDHVVQGWETMRAMLPDVLGPLQARVEAADLGERGVYLRLKAGPFATRADALSACTELSQSAIYCQAMAFTGDPLEAESEN
ncbi:SPOR domain-containing protein [Hyphobacterium sp. SN044]|uniref:SPOR domain-containing protein n=1 Tax=Hyphobacterium sp. SN044 TaxID=2912575 RepID=UPI001F467A47|nr:SPOR domain-containing protein [Hyphobacterium sp. SN044]MCF8878788.1 SPOR domain-containing protein [Hyphobacterium sp. SN044]